jgi:tetratricopeptide (TPR) repeat protein
MASPDAHAEFIQTQVNLRAVAEDQSSALASVGTWLAEVRTKEATLLSSRAPRRVRTPSVAADGGPPANRGDVLEVLREEGNAAIAAGDYARAAALYSRVLAARPSFAPLANRALAYLKLHDYRGAIADSTDALRMDAFHTKSWMRRAAARSALGQYALAASDLAIARALEPTNKTVLTEARKMAESIKAALNRAPDVTINVSDDN